MLASFAEFYFPKEVPANLLFERLILPCEESPLATDVPFLVPDPGAAP